DNGPAFQGSPGPFRGGKTDLHEGGIRVPLIAVWPGRIPANTYSFQTAHMADLLPTISAAAGREELPGDLDGVNLLSHLEGGPESSGMRFCFKWTFIHSFRIRAPNPSLTQPPPS